MHVRCQMKRYNCTACKPVQLLFVFSQVVSGLTYGVAKNASLLAVRALECLGNGTVSQVVSSSRPGPIICKSSDKCNPVVVCYISRLCRDCLPEEKSAKCLYTCASMAVKPGLLPKSASPVGNICAQLPPEHTWGDCSGQAPQ